MTLHSYLPNSEASIRFFSPSQAENLTRARLNSALLDQPTQALMLIWRYEPYFLTVFDDMSRSGGAPTIHDRIGSVDNVGCTDSAGID